jgi:hypothetical protein
MAKVTAKAGAARAKVKLREMGSVWAVWWDSSRG